MNFYVFSILFAQLKNNDTLENFLIKKTRVTWSLFFQALFNLFIL